jgi:hypothetical protein
VWQRGQWVQDAVLDVTANALTAFEQAITLARFGRTVVDASAHGSGIDVPGFSFDRVIS